VKYTQVVAAIQNVNGASFVGIDTLIEVKLTGGKKNPMQGRITKRMVGASVMVFQNKNSNGYENMVERRLIQEGKDPTAFSLGPRLWGTRIPNMPIIEHFKDNETKYYLEVIFLKPGKVEYKLDGAPIDEADIEGLPVVKSDPEAQGGLDNTVIVRTFSADSITEIRVDGKVFN
jgi:hypothetical protein